VKSGLAGARVKRQKASDQRRKRARLTMTAPLTVAGLMSTPPRWPHRSSERGQKNATRWYNGLSSQKYARGRARLCPPLKLSVSLQHKPLGLCILQLFIPLRPTHRVAFWNFTGWLGIQRRGSPHQFFKALRSRSRRFISAGNASSGAFL